MIYEQPIFTWRRLAGNLVETGQHYVIITGQIDRSLVVSDKTKLMLGRSEEKEDNKLKRKKNEAQEEWVVG